MRTSCAADDEQLCAALDLQRTDGRNNGIWWRQDSLCGVALPPWPPPDFRAIMDAQDPSAGASLAGWQDVLFLDTETTGLAGGTGTLVFLVGLGWWDAEGFVVRQLLLAGPHREQALLDELAALAARFKAVVTYNGNAFDLPLLRTRARLAGRADPCAGLASWDLLKAVRTLWRRQLPDCRQQTVEQEVCRYRRGPGDIAGGDIPGVYRSFLIAGETGHLARVLIHNRRDIEGLGLIFGAVARAAERIADGPCAGRGSATAAWSNALVCERRRQRAEAASWAASLVSRDLLFSLPLSGILDTIRQLKRMAAWQLVAVAVEHGLDRWPAATRLHYEAAVLYEHRLADARRAMNHAAVLRDERRLARLRARLASTWIARKPNQTGGPAHE